MNPSDEVSAEVNSFVCEKPVITLEGDNIIMTCATTGARIYYSRETTDMEMWPLYEGPITLDDNRPFYAYAKAYNFNDSQSTVWNEGNVKCAMPVITVVDSSLSATFTATCTTPGATIHYRLEYLDASGATTYTDWAEYTGSAVALPHNCTIHAIATKANVEDSETATAKVESFQCADPVITPDGNKIKMECSTPNARIYYTRGDEQPTDKSTLYTGEITVDDNRPYNAIAYAVNFNPSGVTTITPGSATCATPVINISGATATITCGTSGASIKYTLKYLNESGAETETDAAIYTDPIQLTHNCTIRAWAEKANMNSSQDATATVNTFLCATPVITLDGDKIIMTCSTAGARIYYSRETTDMETWPLYEGPIILDDNRPFYAYAKAYNFNDSQSTVWNEGNVKCAMPVITVVDSSLSATFTATCTTPGATIHYRLEYLDASGATTYTDWAEYTGSAVALPHNCTIHAIATKANVEDSETATAKVESFQCADPVITPDGNKIKMECSTPNARIYYTRGDEQPTDKSTPYTDEITVDDNRPYNAIAYAVNFNPSGVTKFTPNTATCATPVITISGATGTITCGTDGATIKYRLEYLNENGEAYVTDWFNYAGTLQFTHNCTVRAYAQRANMNDSQEVTATVNTFACEKPVITLEGNKVIMTCSTPNARIYYTRGDEQPTDKSTPYTGEITVDDNRPYNAIAYAVNFNPSGVTKFTPNTATCATPVITISGATGTITCGTDGVTIKYRLEYLNENGEAYVTDWFNYAGTLQFTHNCTVRAYAQRANMNDSQEVTATVNTFLCATPVITLDGDKIRMTCSTAGARIYYSRETTDMETWSLYEGPITLDDNRPFYAYAKAYNFNDSQSTVWNEGNVKCATPVITVEGNSFTITCYTPGASISYQLEYLNADGSKTLTDWTEYTGAAVALSHNCTIYAKARKANVHDSETATAEVGTFRCENPVITPDGNKVIMTCSTPNARIYYTRGDEQPTDKSTLYTGEITVDDNRPYNAIAYAVNFNPSGVTSFTPGSVTCATPVITISDNEATIYSGTSGATIVYSLRYTNENGEDFETEWTVYNQPIPLTHNCTISAYALKENMNESPVVTATVDTFQCEAPAIWLDGNNVVMASSTPNARVYYTHDNSQPKIEWMLYTNAIPHEDSRPYYAYAQAYNFNDSEVTMWQLGEVKCETPVIHATTDSREFTITCGTQGATITYRLESQDVNESGVHDYTPWTEYTEGELIPLEYNCTIWAKATKDYNTESEMAFVEIRSFYCEKPVIELVDGKIIITCATENAEIYYTRPSGSGDVYWVLYPADGFVLDDNRPIYAYASARNFNDSEIAVWDNGDLTCEAPEITINEQDRTFQLDCADDEVTLEYMLSHLDGNGAQYSTDWLPYTGAVTLEHNCTITARASKEHFNSAEASETVDFFYCENPVIELEDGIITITCTTPGAWILYSRDNSVAINQWLRYPDEGIMIEDNRPVYAVARAYNFNQSGITEWRAGTLQCAKPEILVADDGNSFTITCETNGAKVSYRIDYLDSNGEPTSDNGEFVIDDYIEVPFTMPLTHNCAILATATKDYLNDSERAVVDVTHFYCAKPEITLQDGIIIMTCDTPGAWILYSYRPELPLVEWIPYPEGGFYIEDNRPISAMARAYNFNDSETAEWKEGQVKCATPVIHVDDDGNSFTIDCATDGAVIEYRLEYLHTDGATILTQWTVYTDAVPLSHNCTIRAKANRDYMIESDEDVKEVNTFYCAIPTFREIDGRLTIECTTPNSKIYYTIGDAIPDEYATAYTEPIEVTDLTTYRAIAYAMNFNPSVMSEYSTNWPTCTPPLIVIKDNVLTFFCEEGSTVHYTLDGSQPTRNSDVPTSAIVLDHNCIVLAIASRDKFKDSALAMDVVDNFICTEPTFSQAGYWLTISHDGNPGQEIYYTIGDADNPMENWTRYEDMIQLTDLTPVYAVCVKTDFHDSTIATFNPGQISCDIPVINYDGQMITISANNSTACYALNDDDLLYGYDSPISARDVYSIKAVARRDNYYDSEAIRYILSYYDSEQRAVTMRSAGYLSEAFGWVGDDTQTITGLKIQGPVNNDDFATLRDYKHIEDLDLTDASADSIPTGAFKDMKALRCVFLSERMATGEVAAGRATGADLFDGCVSLAAVDWRTAKKMGPDAMRGTPNPNVLLYVTREQYAPSNFRGNLIVNRSADNITLVDGEYAAFYTPYSFNARNVQYIRDFRLETRIGVRAGWETIVLPFDVKSITHETHSEEITPFGGAGEYHFWLSGINDGKLSPTDKIKAYKPYAISMPNSPEYFIDYNLGGLVTFSATDVTFDISECEAAELNGGKMLRGTMKRIGIDEGLYIVNVESYTEGGDTYMPGSIFVNDRDVRAFEAYLTNSDGTPLHAPLPIGHLMDNANGLGDVLCTPPTIKAYTDGATLYIISPDDRTVDLYTAGGIYIRPLHLTPGTNTVTDLPRGIYILNGIKIAI